MIILLRSPVLVWSPARALAASLLASFLGAACSSAPPAGPGESGPRENVGVAEGRDVIAPFDDPSGLLGVVSRRLADNIAPEDIGQVYGAPDEGVPYPDSYWPMTENGIDARWNTDDASPLEKYMSLFDPARLELARTWNSAHHGSEVPGVKSWYGICQGWAAAAVLERPVTHAVSVKREGDRPVVCAAEETGCTHFEIGDINGLLAEVYADARARFIGARCDTPGDEIVRDESGRIDREANGAGCKGLNPGALLMVLRHRLQRDRLPFVLDAQTDWNTDQIWNQPAYRYSVNRYEPLTAAQAANLVATGQREGEPRPYVWNVGARGFVFVDLTVFWVTEHGPSTHYVSGLEWTRSTRVVAVVELDAPPEDPAATIVGGEYLDDATVGATRLRVLPFVWLPLGPAPERRWGGGHNPYVRARVVQALARLAR